jgi:ribosomal protein L32
VRKLSDIEIERAIEMRRSGYSLMSIAHEYNVHFTTIALWTGPEEKRKKKFTHKKATLTQGPHCSSCGVIIRTDEKVCDCRFPPLLKRYFFTPKEY